MKKLGVFLLGFIVIILVPATIIWLGISLTQKNTIRYEQRQDQLPNWDAKEIAAKYAPILFQQTSNNKQYRSWDYICSLGFDGDDDLTNNLQSLQNGKQNSFEASIYYALLESESHFYITYSIFHPLEWGNADGKITPLYENELEHLQVVVAKKQKDSIEGEVLCVSIHSSKGLKKYKTEKAKIGVASDFSSDALFLCNDEGKVDTSGTHPAIFVETGLHNLSMLSNAQTQKAFAIQGQEYTLQKGVRYSPAATASAPKGAKDFEQANYALKDMFEVFWLPSLEDIKIREKLYKKNFFRYRDALLRISKIPYYLQGKGLQGKSLKLPNVTPFAFDSTGKNPRGAGKYFFNPVKAYRKYLRKSPNWSLLYLYHPYYPIKSK